MEWKRGLTSQVQQGFGGNPPGLTVSGRELLLPQRLPEYPPLVMTLLSGWAEWWGSSQPLLLSHPFAVTAPFPLDMLNIPCGFYPRQLTLLRPYRPVWNKPLSKVLT